MNIRWVQGLAEDLPAVAPGPYRLVTFGQSFHWTDEQQVAETVYDMLEPGGALGLIVHKVTGRPGRQTPGCLRSLMMRSRRWWRNISDLPGGPAGAPPQNGLTASRMCWPGLALVSPSSSSSPASPTCCEIARASCPAYRAGDVGRLAVELGGAQQVRMSVADV